MIARWFLMPCLGRASPRRHDARRVLRLLHWRGFVAGEGCGSETCMQRRDDLWERGCWRGARTPWRLRRAAPNHQAAWLQSPANAFLDAVKVSLARDPAAWVRERWCVLSALSAMISTGLSAPRRAPSFQPCDDFPGGVQKRLIAVMIFPGKHAEDAHPGTVGCLQHTAPAASHLERRRRPAAVAYSDFVIKGSRPGATAPGSGGWFHLAHPRGRVRSRFDVVELADHCITSSSTPQHVGGSWVRDGYPRLIPRDDPIDDGSRMHNVAVQA